MTPPKPDWALAAVDRFFADSWQGINRYEAAKLLRAERRRVVRMVQRHRTHQGSIDQCIDNILAALRGKE